MRMNLINIHFKGALQVDDILPCLFKLKSRLSNFNVKIKAQTLKDKVPANKISAMW
jgi:hypothetical protein